MGMCGSGYRIAGRRITTGPRATDDHGKPGIAIEGCFAGGHGLTTRLSCALLIETGALWLTGTTMSASGSPEYSSGLPRYGMAGVGKTNKLMVNGFRGVLVY